MPSGNWSFTTLGQNKMTQFNGDGSIFGISYSNRYALTATWQRVSVNSPSMKNLLVNPFSYKKRKIGFWNGYEEIDHNGFLAIRYDGYLTTSSSGLLEVVQPPSEIRNAVVNESINRVLDQIKDQKVNIAVAVAERKQAMKMVLSTASHVASTGLTLGEAIDSLDTGDRKARKAASRKLSKLLTGSSTIKGKAKHLSNLILQVKYGWKPLLSDIKGAAEQVAERESVKTPTAKAVGMRRLQFDTTASNSTVKGFQTGYYSAKTFIRYRISSGQELTSLGFTNPLHLMWESTSLSFVADWILPIGAYLGRLDATFSCEFIYGGVTTVYDARMESEDTVATSSFRRKAKGFIHVFEVDRTRLTAFPSPPLPSIQNPFSLPNSISALALIVQRLK